MKTVIRIDNITVRASGRSDPAQVKAALTNIAPVLSSGFANNWTNLPPSPPDGDISSHIAHAIAKQIRSAQGRKG